jgi:hypothetical protein
MMVMMEMIEILLLLILAGNTDLENGLGSPDPYTATTLPKPI